MHRSSGVDVLKAVALWSLLVAPPDPLLAQRVSRSQSKKLSVDKPCYTLHWQLLTSRGAHWLWDDTKTLLATFSPKLLAEMCIVHLMVGLCQILLLVTFACAATKHVRTKSTLFPLHPVCSDWSWWPPLLAIRPSRTIADIIPLMVIRPQIGENCHLLRPDPVSDH